MAMAAPTDSEQIVRRHEASATGQHVAIPLIAPCFPVHREFFLSQFQTLGIVPFHAFPVPQFPHAIRMKGRAPPAIV